MKRVLVAVDVTNQYYSVTHASQGTRIDYSKYLQLATRGLNLYRAFAYGVELDDEAFGFKTVLRNLGYEPRYRRATIYGETGDMRRTDRNLMMAMDIWRTIDKVDIVVIGSSDPELVPLVQRIKELGIQVIVISHNISRELRDAADRYIEVDLVKMQHVKND